MDKQFTSRLSSPIATSGSGHSFEIDAQTLFAVLMLAHGRVPGFPNSEIIEIDQQKRVKGWNIDDFMLLLYNTDTNTQHKILFQAKQKIAISDNDDFKEIIKAAYYDYCDNRFNKQEDIIVLLCGALSRDEIDAISFIQDTASAHKSATSFFEEIRTARYANETCRDLIDVFKGVIQTIAENVSDEEIFMFLKRFHVWSVDFQHNDGFLLALMHSYIVIATNNTSPHIIWASVADFMERRNKNSGETGIDDFSDDIKKFFSDPKPYEMPTDLYANRLTTESNDNASYVSSTNRIHNHQYFKDFFYALLVGGWNENSVKDRSFIEKLTKADYDSWRWKISSLTNDFHDIIIFKNNEWNVFKRKELFPLFGNDIHENDLLVFEKEAIKCLSELNPEFNYPTNTRFYQGQRTQDNYSSRLRYCVSETLAIIANTLDSQNYWYNITRNVAQSVVSQVLKTNDYKVWGSLCGNLGELAEAAPNVFLDAVEDAFCTTQNAFAQLYEEETGDSFLTSRQYSSGIISALERLAWVDSFFLRSAEVLIWLAHCKPGQFNSSSLSSLTTILLPWHPQTEASPDTRKEVINHLIKIAPEPTWHLLLSLLPGSNSSTLDTARPLFLSNAPNKFKIDVTNSEYWDISKYYLSYAIKLADNNPSRVLKLIDFIDDVPPESQKEILDLISCDGVLKKTDEERYPLWKKLLSLIGRHRTYSYTNWALPEESIKKIEFVAEHIRPKKYLLECLLLFSWNSMDYFRHTPGDMESIKEVERIILEKQKQCVRKILRNDGITTLLELVEKVDNSRCLGFVAASVCSLKKSQQILDSYLNSESKQINAFLSSFILQKYEMHENKWLDHLSRSRWSITQTVAYLCELPITQYVLSIKDKWLKGHEQLYWSKLEIFSVSMIDDNCFYYVINQLLKYGRPIRALELLGQKKYNSDLTFDATIAWEALFTKEKTKDKQSDMTGYYITNVIKMIQASDKIDDNKKAIVEWYYIDLLKPYLRDNDCSLKYLYHKLSTEPEFFCEMLGYLYKSANKVDSNDKKQLQLTDKAYKLFSNWNLLPGYHDESLDYSEFEKWFNKTISISKQVGLFDSALIRIGQVLFYSPEEEDKSLWIDKRIAELLDTIGYRNLLVGYRRECINSAGSPHWRDPSVITELSLAKQYEDKAKALSLAGYPRFASAINEVAETLRGFAKR